MTDLPFFRPELGDEEVAAVTAAVRSGWLTTGPRAREFEQRFAEYVGAPHAVAVSSATAALHVAVLVAGIGKGDEVIVPTMTFTATAAVVVHAGARPVLVDCEPGTLNIDVGAAADAVTPRTRAIMPVHFAGRPADMDPVLELARRHDLVVIEDAAHALPAAYRGRRVGTMGTATCFSFYANKTITTGEGGMLVTADGVLADRARVLSLHGLDGGAWKRFTRGGSWDYDVVTAGFKYNMGDVAAALGLAQLGRCDEFREARRRIAAGYDAAFAGSDLVVPLDAPAADVEHAWHLYVVGLDVDRLDAERGEIVSELAAAGIGTSVHYKPLHLHPFYRDEYDLEPERFPIATDAFRRIVSLPIYPAMTDGDVSRAAATLLDLVARHARR